MTLKKHNLLGELSTSPFFFEVSGHKSVEVRYVCIGNSIVYAGRSFDPPVQLIVEPNLQRLIKGT